MFHYQDNLRGYYTHKTMKKILLSLLLIPTIAYAAVTFPVNGGTGTSTKPTIGQILLGLSNGTYAPVATSSLGISGGTTYTGTYPIIVSGSVISSGFATSTTNVFSATNTFNGQLNFGNASGTGLSATGLFGNLYPTGITNSWISVDTLGKIIATSSPIAGSGNSAWTIGNAIIYNATTTDKVGIGTTTIPYKLTVEMASTTDNTGINLAGWVNDFLQFNVQNRSTNIKAESGYSATSDVGTATTSFMWIGINNSLFANNQTYTIGSKLDTSVLGKGNDMYIANGSTTGKMVFATGGTSTSTNNRLTITSGGNVSIATTSTTYGFNVGTTTGLLATTVSGAATFSNTTLFSGTSNLFRVASSTGITAGNLFATSTVTISGATTISSTTVFTGTFNRFNVSSTTGATIGTLFATSSATIATSSFTGNMTISTGTYVPRVLGYASNASTTFDVFNIGDGGIATTTISGTSTIVNPTGVLLNGLMFEMWLKATTTTGLFWGTLFASSTDVQLPTQIASGTTKIIVEYRQDSGKLECAYVNKTFAN